MPNRYANGDRAWGICQRCGMRHRRSELREDGYIPNLLVGPDCWDDAHPQERLIRVDDAEGIYKPSLENLNSTAPVLTITRTGATMRMDWTAAAFAASMVRSYDLYLSTDGVAFNLVSSQAVIYDDFGELVLEPLFYTGYPLTADTTFSAYVVANDGAGESAASNIDTLVVTLLSANPEGMMYRSGASSVTFDPVADVNAIAGDLLLFIGFASWQTSTGTISTPAGWNKLGPTGSSVATGFANNFYATEIGVPIMAWKFWAPGDAPTFSASGGGTLQGVSGILHNYRNARPINPIPQFGVIGTDAGKDVLGTPIMYVGGDNSVVGLQALVHGQTADPFGVATVPDTPIRSASGSLVSGLTSPVHQKAMVWNVLKSEQENLLSHGRLNFNSNWTLTGLSLGNDSYDPYVNGSRCTYWRPNTAGEHKLTKTVELVAGQTYTLMVSAIHSNSGSEAPVKAVVSEGANSYGAQWKSLNGGSAIANIGTPSRTFFTAPYIGASLAAAGGIMNITFTPVNSGTHTVTIGTRNNSNADSYTPSAGADFMLSYAVLSRGEYPIYPSGHIFTSGTALTGVLGARSRPIFMNGGVTNTMNGIWFEVAASTPDTSKLMIPSIRVVEDDVAGSYMTTRRPDPISTTFGENARSVLRVNRHVAPSGFGGPGKYYAEVTFPNWLTGAFNEPAVFVLNHITMPNNVLPSTFPPIGHLIYGSSADVKQRGYDNVVSTFCANSAVNTGSHTIGVGVDYESGNVLFYLDGVLRSTQPMLKTDIPYCLWVNQNRSNSLQYNVLSVNTTGPFLAKPAGFSAWDWENEQS